MASANMRLVALLAEGGDRNNRYVMQGIVQGKSPSSRRAGIEINKPIVVS